MYKQAYLDKDIVVYFDVHGNKYVASGGSLAWRINNPGLISSRNPAASVNKPIGHFDGVAIFAEPEQGFKALSDWLHSEKCQNCTIDAIAKHYRPKNFDDFIDCLTKIVGVSREYKVGMLSKLEFEKLVLAVGKACGYSTTGNEKFSLIPKITAKIEHGKDISKDTYLIGSNVIITKTEAIDQVISNQLDAVIVRARNGNMYLRSRPTHSMQHLQHSNKSIFSFGTEIEILARSIGEKKEGQCTWGYINGIANTKNEAIESARKISLAAEGELVLSMPNDQILWGIGNLIGCFALKFSIKTPIINSTLKFFRHLLKLAGPIDLPVVVFAHSQGAIITEHVLEYLDHAERKNLRIFTFGGGSFISPGKCHPDSHNYVSANDMIPSIGSPYLHNLALELYHGNKKGMNRDEIIKKLAIRDARLLCSFLRNPHGYSELENHITQASNSYKRDLEKISNVTVLDPEDKIEHAFNTKCYQSVMQGIVKKYRKEGCNNACRKSH